MKKQSYKKRRDEMKTKRIERQKAIDCLDVLWERIGRQPIYIYQRDEVKT